MSGRAMVYWGASLPVFAVFLGSGIANVVHVRHVAVDMAQLGYPTYFSTLLGVWKVLGALAVAAPSLPRLKEWAYAGMIFDLTGAAVSRWVAGSGASGIVPPLAVAALVIVSWASRPEDRTLRPLQRADA